MITASKNNVEEDKVFMAKANAKSSLDTFCRRLAHMAENPLNTRMLTR